MFSTVSAVDVGLCPHAACGSPMTFVEPMRRLRPTSNRLWYAEKVALGAELGGGGPGHSAPC